jgi:thiamine pyrophosphokinase
MANKKRGVAFIGGEGPGPDKALRFVQEASLWGTPLIAAADSGLIAAEAAGLRPDWVIGDMDSLDDKSRLVKYPPGRVLIYPREKDYTDTELVFKLLRDKGCDEIWLIGGGGGRMDHLFGIRSLFEREKAPERWITAAEDVFRLDAPGEYTFGAGAAELKAELSPGRLVSVFPLGSGPWTAESSGLKWTLAGVPWDRGFFGVSNEASLSSFSIKMIQGRFMVIIGGFP